MKIEATQTLTDKEGYDALLYFLLKYWELTGSEDVGDILSGAEYFWGDGDEPADIAFWYDWLEAVEKAKTKGSFPRKILLNENNTKDS